DLRPAAMDDDEVDAGLLHQHDVLCEIGRLAAARHRVAAELHDDGLLVVFQDVRQRLHQDARRRTPARHHPHVAVLGEIVLKGHASSPAKSGAYNLKTYGTASVARWS